MPRERCRGDGRRRAGRARRALPMAGAARAGAGGASANGQDDKAKDGPAERRRPGAARAPRCGLREYFPETLLWQPGLITDDQGRAELPLTFADSITTWRLTASASSQGGALGGVTAPLRVFQDFFVDIDLPIGPDPERRGRLPRRRL